MIFLIMKSSHVGHPINLPFGDGKHSIQMVIVGGCLYYSIYLIHGDITSNFMDSHFSWLKLNVRTQNQCRWFSHLHKVWLRVQLSCTNPLNLRILIVQRLQRWFGVCLYAPGQCWPLEVFPWHPQLSCQCSCCQQQRIKYMRHSAKERSPQLTVSKVKNPPSVHLQN